MDGRDARPPCERGRRARRKLVLTLRLLQRTRSASIRFPNLANQPAALFKQLRDYKSESRQGGQADVMTPMAQELDETQMADTSRPTMPCAILGTWRARRPARDRAAGHDR